MSAAPVSLELHHAAVKQHCKILRMPAMSAQFSMMAEQAVRGRQTHVGYLEALLAADLEERGWLCRRLPAHFPWPADVQMAARSFFLHSGRAIFRGRTSDTCLA